MASDETIARVPAKLWHGSAKPPRLEHVLSQIRTFLKEVGYSKTVTTLEREAKHGGVALYSWLEEDEGPAPTSLMEMWADAAEGHGLPLPSGYKGNRSDEEESSNDDEEAEGGALVDKEAEEISDDSSDENSSSGSDSGSSVKVGEKRKRVLTPSSSEDDSSGSGSESGSDAKMKDASPSSDSDSNSDSSSSESEDERPSKRTKVSNSDKSSDSSSSESDSDSDSTDLFPKIRTSYKKKEAERIKEAASKKSKSETKAAESSEDDDLPLTKTKKKTPPGKKSSIVKESKSESGSESSSSSDSDSQKSVSSKSVSSNSASDSSSGSSSSSSGDNDSTSSSDSSGSESDDESSESDSPAPRSPSPKKTKKSKPSKVEKPRSPSPVKVKTDVKKKAKKEPEQQMFSSIHPDRMINISKTGSATSSSATLAGDDPPEPKRNEKATDTLIVPDNTAATGTKQIPATKENMKKLKKEQVPFSRIPADQKVDPKFSSNEYVPYDYADRAYKDLSVTKGKGFTKEKNKKKRGTSAPSNKPAKPAWKSKLEEQCRWALSPSPPRGDFHRLPARDMSPVGFKEDTWAFMSGCGFNPMGGSFGRGW